MNEETKKLVETLKHDDVFCNFVADFAERMVKHLNWETKDNTDELQRRLNAAHAELNRFLFLFA